MLVMQNNDLSSSLQNEASSHSPASATAAADDSKVDSNGVVPELGAQSYEDRNGQHHPIAEFLYQLTKMLTDDNNEIIEWADGRIKVHYPERLEGDVLHKYFRHSKFASFQRQLNYFGFRKIAGKGKMSPCSYVNESATSDIRSLLLIKRKTNGSAARKAAMQQRAAEMVNQVAVNPGLAGINLGTNFATNPLFAAAAAAGGNANQQALANAMALLSENALRAGIGSIPLSVGNGTTQQTLNSQVAATAQLNLLAMQHQRLQKQLLEQQNLLNQQQDHSKDNGNKASVSFAANLFATDSQQDQLQQLRNFSTTSMGSLDASSASLEQLQAHLKALEQQSQQQNAASAAANNLSSLLGANAAFNRATAALNAQQMPATAAIDAATGQQAAANNLFESAANLKSLLEEHSAEQRQSQHVAATQQLLNRYPSNGELLGAHHNMSTLSFGNLLGSSNRLSSLLSLNSFLGSREVSMADFAAAMPQNVREQLQAASNHLAAHDAATKFRANNNHKSS